MTKNRFNEMLLNLAKESIGSYFDETLLNQNEWIENEDLLKQQKATFVTLTLNGQLRGCIGTLVAHRSLYEDITSNALSSAFKDPRFKPLTPEEFSLVDIELSILSEPQLINYINISDLKAQLKIGVHGVILKYKNNQATFLPQVWEQLATFELFFEHLCAKAGLSMVCLNEGALIYTYEVEKIK